MNNIKNVKVFIIIGMCLGFFLIFPILLGLFAIKKLESANCKEDLESWGIITCLFVSLIGGILMISLRDEDFLVVASGHQLQAKKTRKNNKIALLNEIEDLFKLKNEAIITDDEYQAKKTIILSRV